MQENHERKRIELFFCRTINAKKNLSRIDSSKLKQKIAKSKMDNYALVIDISSDKENQRYSTPIKTLPVNMVGRLNLSDSSVEVWRGSEADLNSTQESVSTFESDTEEAFVVESHQKENSEDYYEEPDSSREMPELSRAPVLADITNEKEYVPLSKTEKLNDLDEPSIKEIEETHGLSMTEDYYCTAGRGNSFTSARIRRARKQHVLIAREIPHCPRPWSTSYRGVLSRPAPGRDFSCCGGIPKFARGQGHGRTTQN